VVEVSRRTETGDAPGSQGAKRENIGRYLSVESRSEAGCSAGRMQTDLHHGLLGAGRQALVRRRRGTGDLGPGGAHAGVGPSTRRFRGSLRAWKGRGARKGQPAGPSAAAAIRGDGGACRAGAGSSQSAQSACSSIATSMNGSARTTSVPACVASSVQRPFSRRSTSSVRAKGSISHACATPSRA